jgi:hypothetical protein
MKPRSEKADHIPIIEGGIGCQGRFTNGGTS